MNPGQGKRKGRKREKYTTEHVPLEFPSCLVCGKDSTGIHFGVYSCEACKTFFRRSLLRQTPYKCDKNDNCPIDAGIQKGARSCPACRLQKCVDCGMSKDGVRQGRYTMTQRTNVILEVQKLRESGSALLRETVQNDEQLLSEQSRTSTKISSSGSSSNSSIQDKEILDLSKDIQRTSIMLGDEESAVSCDLSSPDNPSDVLRSIMTAYGYLEHFTKFLTDREIRDLLEDGKSKYVDKTNLFGKLDYLPKEQYNDFYEKTQIDVDGRKKLLSEGKYEFMKMANDLVKFSKNIPFFCDLDIEDQKALLKGSHFEFFTILLHRSMDLDTEMCISYTGKVLSLDEACPYTDKQTMLRWAEFSRDVCKLCLSPEELALVLGICITFRGKLKRQVRT
uniref:Probable nuclear hormone receptor HR3 isoform X2 n=1 Tax=Crassostrea virginica TaxID=6565 RepID=A0A8B8DPL7_CRAVI|nr:probable nuclear hormone receptor HR3 isoform X2 [Crassostrea virginica]